MSNIEIESYNVVVPNMVFERRVSKERAKALGVQRESVRDVLYLTRFTPPTKEEVQNHIITTARSLIEGNFKIIHHINIETVYMLTEMDKMDIERIADGDANIIEDITNHFKRKTPKGNSYLGIVSSVVPAESLKIAEYSSRKVESFIPYELMVVSSELSEESRILINNQGKVLDSLELEYLLSRGVRVSDVLSITAFGPEKYETEVQKIRLVHKALGNNGNLAKLIDNSPRVRDVSSFECLAKHSQMNFPQGIELVLGSTITLKELMDKINPPKRPSYDPADPTAN